MCRDLQPHLFVRSAYVVDPRAVRTITVDDGRRMLRDRGVPGQPSPGKQQRFAPGAILAVSPSDPAATAVIRLIVEGNIPVGSTAADSAGGASTADFDRVQGAGITYTGNARFCARRSDEGH